MDTEEQDPTLVPREQHYKKIKNTTWQDTAVCRVWLTLELVSQKYSIALMKSQT